MKTDNYWPLFGKGNIDGDPMDFCMQLLKAEWEVNQQEGGEEFKCYMIWQVTMAMLHATPPYQGVYRVACNSHASPKFLGPTYAPTVWPRATKSDTLTHGGLGRSVLLEGRPCPHHKGWGPIVPKNFGTRMCTQIRKNNQILHDDQTRCEENLQGRPQMICLWKLTLLFTSL